LDKLKEFCLEWFLYVRPPRQKHVKATNKEGRAVMNSMKELCLVVEKHGLIQCNILQFLGYFSNEQLDLNMVDN
jgi:hypothetical protein